MLEWLITSYIGDKSLSYGRVLVGSIDWEYADDKH